MEMEQNWKPGLDEEAKRDETDVTVKGGPIYSVT